MAVEASHINKRVVDGQVKYVVERPKILRPPRGLHETFQGFLAQAILGQIPPK